MDSDIERTIKNFREIFYKGIPVMLAQNETALLAFMCMMAGTDALAAYRYDHNNVGKRFEDFVTGYFPPAYGPHAKNLYLFRCRLLHNFSPAYFSVAHNRPDAHLKPSGIGDSVLSDDVFFADIKSAAEKYFAELPTHQSCRRRCSQGSRT
jgi:hypothetical protein